MILSPSEAYWSSQGSSLDSSILRDWIPIWNLSPSSILEVLEVFSLSLSRVFNDYNRRDREVLHSEIQLTQPMKTESLLWSIVSTFVESLWDLVVLDLYYPIESMALTGQVLCVKSSNIQHLSTLFVSSTSQHVLACTDIRAFLMPNLLYYRVNVH